MTDEQKATIVGYVTKLNTTISGESNELLDLVVDEVADRVLLYLNTDVLDSRLERVVARVVVGVYNQTNNNKESTTAEQSVSSMSDNGQSISYRNEVQNYLATADDGALFGGFAALLAPYRRIDVISS